MGVVGERMSSDLRRRNQSYGAASQQAIPAIGAGEEGNDDDVQSQGT